MRVQIRTTGRLLRQVLVALSVVVLVYALVMMVVVGHMVVRRFHQSWLDVRHELSHLDIEATYRLRWIVWIVLVSEDNSGLCPERPGEGAHAFGLFMKGVEIEILKWRMKLKAGLKLRGFLQADLQKRDEFLLKLKIRSMNNIFCTRTMELLFSSSYMLKNQAYSFQYFPDYHLQYPASKCLVRLEIQKEITICFLIFQIWCSRPVIKE